MYSHTSVYFVSGNLHLFIKAFQRVSSSKLTYCPHMREIENVVLANRNNIVCPVIPTSHVRDVMRKIRCDNDYLVQPWWFHTGKPCIESKIYATFRSDDLYKLSDGIRLTLE